MINIFQRHWHSSTRRSSPKPVNVTADGAAVKDPGKQSKGQIIAETIYCDTDCEVGARLRVDPISFKIMEATWETYSLPVTITDVPELRGVEAYFNSGQAISKAADHLGPIAHTLFSETVGCIILSEPFMYKERGFASAAEYREYWDVIYLNACRYYSNLDTASELWDYSNYTRTSILFNKFASQNVFALPGGGFRVVATYSDSFHEISVDFDMDSNLVITRGAGGLLRAPHAICRKVNAFLPYLQQLAGYDANNPGKKQLALVLGQSDGCVHLIDTVYDALTAANMAANRSS